jgi:Ankyrin repeats (many copies)
VDHNLPDLRGNTPLVYAIVRGHLSVLDMLLQKDGIDVNAQNIVGSTALAYACADTQPDDHTVDSVRLILSHPDIDPNILDNNGVSALSRVTGGTDQYRERIESLLRAAGAR